MMEKRKKEFRDLVFVSLFLLFSHLLFLLLIDACFEQKVVPFVGPLKRSFEEREGSHAKNGILQYGRNLTVRVRQWNIYKLFSSHGLSTFAYK